MPASGSRGRALAGVDPTSGFTRSTKKEGDGGDEEETRLCCSRHLAPRNDRRRLRDGPLVRRAGRRVRPAEDALGQSDLGQRDRLPDECLHGSLRRGRRSWGPVHRRRLSHRRPQRSARARPPARQDRPHGERRCCRRRDQESTRQDAGRARIRHPQARRRLRQSWLPLRRRRPALQRRDRRRQPLLRRLQLAVCRRGDGRRRLDPATLGRNPRR